MKTTNASLMPRLHAVLRNDLLKPNAHNPSSGRDYFPMTALATLNYPACRRPTLPPKGVICNDDRGQRRDSKGQLGL